MYTDPPYASCSIRDLTWVVIRLDEKILSHDAQRDKQTGNGENDNAHTVNMTNEIIYYASLLFFSAIYNRTIRFSEVKSPNRM